MRYCKTERLFQRVIQTQKLRPQWLPKSLHTIVMVRRQVIEPIANLVKRVLAVQPAKPTVPIQRSYCVLLVHRDEMTFYIVVPDIGKAYLQYEEMNGIFTINNTVVPPELQGRRIAQILVKSALSYVRNNNLKLRSYCDYATNYIERFEPDLKAIMIN